jgi:hypothetical protein
VFVDQFTKWVELVPTKDQTAVTVIEAFYSNIVCRHGCPQYLLSDNGPQFRALLLDTLCSYFGVKKIFSSAYYPQGDGFAERFMRTLNNSLAALTRGDSTRWDTFLPGLSLAYNASAHEATRISPFELNTGRVPRLPNGPEPTNRRLTNDEVRYFKRLRNTITEAHQRSQTTVQAYWSRMKAYYDKRHSDIVMNPGDLVLIRLSDHEKAKYGSSKLAPRWSRPAKILRRLKNGVTYEVQRANELKESVHVSRLLSLQSPVWGSYFPEPGEKMPESGSERNQRPSKIDVEEEPEGYSLSMSCRDESVAMPSGSFTAGGTSGEDYTTVPEDIRVELDPDEYIAEKIVDSATVEDETYYRVRWLGFGSDDDSWEPIEHLQENCQDLVDEWTRARGNTN